MASADSIMDQEKSFGENDVNSEKPGKVPAENIKPVQSTTTFGNAFNKIKESALFEKVPENVEKIATVNKASHKKSQNCLIVSSRQRGNPILKHVRSVPWEYGEIIPDYVMGETTCAMFLSLRYHTLNPSYIHDRLKILGQQYVLRVLLVQVDVKDPHHELKQLTKICVLADLTLILAWSPEEAGRVLEVYKIYEHKPPDIIMEKQDGNPYSMLVDALTTIKAVNRPDAMTLLATFDSLEGILKANLSELSFCPGIGPQKAKNLYQVLHQNFSKSRK